MSETTYTKGKIEKLFGETVLPKSTIQFYTDRNVVEPAEKPDRRGKPRKYSVANLVELLLCRSMVDLGFSIEDVRVIIHGIKNTSHKDKLDPTTHPKIDKNYILSLCVEYDFNNNAKVTTIEQTAAPNDVSLINVNMATKKHIRIINVTEIIWKVKKATKGAV